MLFPQLAAWPAPATPAAGSGKLVLIERQALVSNASSVTFSGLNGDSQKVYLLTANAVVTSGTAPYVLLRMNGDTGGSYHYSRMDGCPSSAVADPTGAAGQSATSVQLCHFGATSAAATNCLHAVIHASRNAVNRYRMVMAQAVRSDTLRGFFCAGGWNNSADNLTSLQVSLDTGELLAGAEFCLYRLDQTP